MRYEEVLALSDPFRRRLFAKLNPRGLLYPVFTTALLALFLTWQASVKGSNPNRLFGFFQVISVVFFLALTFGLMLPPRCESVSARTSSISNERRYWLLGFCVPVAVGLVAYVRTLPLFFLCDDFAHLESVRRSFAAAIWPQFTKGQDGVFYRPLAFFSLFLDYRIWHEWIPGFHLTSILLHLLCIAGVLQLSIELDLKRKVAFAAALFFAVMPVNVQTVTWTAARFDQLSAALGIWSLASAARFFRTGAYGCSLVGVASFILAVICKENAYVIPLLWLALEVMASTKRKCTPFLKKTASLAGIVTAGAIMLLFRFWLLKGVGGYRTDNAPMALHFPSAALFGLLIRAPGETLFGYDWLEPGNKLWQLSSIITAAVFLMLAFRNVRDVNRRRIMRFTLFWIFVSAVPAHFYFWGPDPGLFVSRTLYFGSMGVAILVALLLEQAAERTKPFLTWTVFVAALLFTGTQHNIDAWQHASYDAKNWLAVLKQQEPSPAPNVTYYIVNVPSQIRGVPYFAAGIESAVRFNYSWRQDIHVVTKASPTIPPGAITINYQQPKD